MAEMQSAVALNHTDAPPEIRAAIAGLSDDLARVAGTNLAGLILYGAWRAGAIVRAKATSMTPVQQVRTAAKWSVEQLAEQLKMKGLVLSDGRWRAARWVPTLIVAAVLLLGLAKIYVGMSRHRPVSLLVDLAIVTAVIALVFFFARASRHSANTFSCNSS